MNRLIEELRELEFNKIHYGQDNANFFESVEGSAPILISAPHGARHLRKNKWKEEDEYTASLAIKLAEDTGAHVICVIHRTREDPNYMMPSTYKESVKEIIRNHGIAFLLDIHGASKKRPFKVCVGTRYDRLERSSCPTFKALIEASLQDFQEQPIFNRQYFRATKDETVTSFARNVCGIESAQIEINARYRIVERKPDSAKALSGEEPFFRAEERDILELYCHLKKMVLRIKEKIQNGTGRV